MVHRSPWGYSLLDNDTNQRGVETAVGFNTQSRGRSSRRGKRPISGFAFIQLSVRRQVCPNVGARIGMEPAATRMLSFAQT
jgi:hypothetical protein